MGNTYFFKTSAVSTATATPSQVTKKQMIILLRFGLVLAGAYLFWHDASPPYLHNNAVVGLLLASNFVLYLLPTRVFQTRYFDHLLVLFDLLLLSVGLWQAPQIHAEFYLVYFLVIMVAATGEQLSTIVIAAFLASVSYLVIVALRLGPHALLLAEVLARVPFFFVVAMFYAYLAQRVHTEHSQADHVRVQLSLAKRLREMSSLLQGSLDRRGILQRLVECQREFCHASYAAVISRGSRTVLAEAGSSTISQSKQARNDLFDLLDQGVQASISQKSFLSLDRSSLEAGILPTFDSELPIFLHGRYALLPLSSTQESDLYLVLMGDFDREMLEYSQVLVLSASMALTNAGQYQTLLHEVENRQQIARQLGEALEFKSQFLANVSHEIRTPIYSFLGYCELLSEGGFGDLGDQQRGVLQRMVENGTQLLDLVNGILDLTKVEAGEIRIKKTPGSLRNFITEIKDTTLPLLRNKALSMRLEVGESIPLLLTDWAVLRQIMLNLVSNAVKFTEKGKVEIVAKYDASRSVIELRVTDTGVGIDREKFEEIFQPFRQLDSAYTKKYAGTGLGLAITKKQVQLLGGKISVESVVGEGSTFFISVPVENVVDGNFRQDVASE